MVPMQVWNVLPVPGEQAALVVLLDEEKKRALPIGIGQAEANAIALGLGKINLQRPMTHDLLVNLIEQLGGRLQRVMVHDMRGQTFIGQLDVATRLGAIEIDCRPSDGIALAVRVGCPILVDEDVLAKSAVDAERFLASPEEPPTWD